ncbi:MAG: hypothetical protein RIN55_07630 [Tissierellaceae bacterium]|nr:hypothetical protein [Tissierellaceae bacterium]
MQDLDFVKVTKDSIIDFLESAEEKIIIAKPAYYESEVNAILSKIIDNGIKVKMFVEEGDQAIRFGFGEEAALDVILNNIKLLNVQTVTHIRLSIVIVDNRVLIFAPAALAWENEPLDFTFPNGFIGNSVLVDRILEQLNIDSSNYLHCETSTKDERDKNVIYFEKFKALKNPNEDTIESKIKETIEALEQIPAVDPLKLRRTLFYRNNYKLINVIVRGKIENKSIDLGPFNRLIKSTERLKSSWRVFNARDIRDVAEYKEYLKNVESIKEKYLFDFKKFGSLIDVENIKEFRNELENEIQIFKKKVTDGSGSSSVTKIVDNSKSELVEYLMSVDMERIVLKCDRYMQSKLNENNEESCFEEAIEKFIMDKLKFPLDSDLISKIDIETFTLDVSDELINENEEFMSILESHKTSNEKGIQIRSYAEGFENI